jgi:aminoglycoside phosphotransferase (APT) family kinase protein
MIWIIQSSCMIIHINLKASIPGKESNGNVITMQGLTKTPLSQQQAQDMVSGHFGTSVSIAEFHELTDGFFNSAYFMELSDGGRWVIKIAPHPSVKVMRYEKGILRTEADVLRLVKDNTDLPVPSVEFIDYTHDRIENDYFIMDYVDGVPLNKIRDSLAAAEARAIDENTGHYLKQMNSITGQFFGNYFQRELMSDSWRDSFDRMLRAVLEDGQSEEVVLPVDYLPLYSRLSEHFAALEEVRIPQLVHWDLWDGNIFIDPITKKITGLIDFERALWGDYLMEANFGAFGVNPSFLRGYGEEIPYSANRRPRRSLYNIYLYLIMVIECYFRKYENDRQEKWARQKLIQELEILCAI